MDNKALTTWDKIKDSEIYFSFIKSPTAIVSSILLAIIFFCSFFVEFITPYNPCLLYTSPSPRDGLLSRMPSSA